jgi:hypothetical protein
MPTKKLQAATEALAKSGFLVSDTVLAGMAREYVESSGRIDTVRGSYLRILVAHAQQELESLGLTRPPTESVLAAVNAAHEHLYAVILSAVVTDEIKDADGLDQTEKDRRTKERNRRSNFARSAKSVLMQWVRTGGKLPSLKPEEVTKVGLEKQFRPARQTAPATVEEKIDATRDRLLTHVQSLAQEDLTAARKLVTAIEAKLNAIVKPKGTSARRRGAAENRTSMH